MSSADQCDKNCNEEKSCKFWTYTKEDKLCTLKKTKGFMVMTPGSVSGINTCIERCNVLHPSTLYVGKALAEDMVNGPEDCEELCRGMVACSFWSYVRTVSLCSLKSTRSLTLTSEDAISGEKVCSHESSPTTTTTTTRRTTTTITTGTIYFNVLVTSLLLQTSASQVQQIYH